MTTEETLDILDQWTLQEARRVNRDVLGDLRAGWIRDKLAAPSNHPGFRGVIRKKRIIVWRSDWVSIHSSPEAALETAINELKRREFDAWKAEKGLQ